MLIQKRPGYSLFEVVATGVVICGVAGSTLFAIEPIHRSRERLQEQRTASYLNGLAEKYHQDRDAWPTQNGGVWELAITGYIDYRNQREEYLTLSKSFVWDFETKSFQPVQ